MKYFENYYGRRVRLLVKGRGYDSSRARPDTNITLEFEATIASETDRWLNLEEICLRNTAPLEGDFTRGTINKDYIIGVFEPAQKQRKSDDISEVINSFGTPQRKKNKKGIFSSQ